MEEIIQESEHCKGKKYGVVPKRVLVLGVPYSVKFDDAETDEDGSCDPSLRKIQIRKEMCKEMTVQVYLHELVHAILAQLGYDEEYEDERLVQGLAIGLHQALFPSTFAS